MIEGAWGLLGPEFLPNARRTRTLGLGASVRRFNDLAVPGLGGVWYGKQLLLATLGVAVAEAARSQGVKVQNIEVANAIEALACWLALKAMAGAVTVACAEIPSCKAKIISVSGGCVSEISTSHSPCEWRPSRPCPHLALSSPTAHDSMHFVARKEEAISLSKPQENTAHIKDQSLAILLSGYWARVTSWRIPSHLFRHFLHSTLSRKTQFNYFAKD